MINLKISQEGSLVEIIENGISRWRKVNTRDLIQALNESIGVPKKQEKVISPMLPLGTICYTPTIGERQYDLWLYQPAKSIDLLYESRSFKKAGIPAAVYKFTVNNGVLTSTDMWAIIEKPYPSAELYHYPIFNVGNSRLCIGSNRINISEPCDFGRVPDMIAMMPSTHAYPSRNRSGLERDSLYKELQGKKFPNKWLTPANKRMGDLIGGII